MTLFMLAAYGFICAAVYHLCPAQIRWAVLLLASYGFYASRSLAGLPFILLTTVSTWLAALVIAQIGENGKAQTNAADRERKKAIRGADQGADNARRCSRRFCLISACWRRSNIRTTYAAGSARRRLGCCCRWASAFTRFSRWAICWMCTTANMAPARKTWRGLRCSSRFFPS